MWRAVKGTAAVVVMVITTASASSTAAATVRLPDDVGHVPKVVSKAFAERGARSVKGFLAAESSPADWYDPDEDELAVGAPVAAYHLDPPLYDPVDKAYVGSVQTDDVVVHAGSFVAQVEVDGRPVGAVLEATLTADGEVRFHDLKDFRGLGPLAPSVHRFVTGPATGAYSWDTTTDLLAPLDDAAREDVGEEAVAVQAVVEAMARRSAEVTLVERIDGAIGGGLPALLLPAFGNEEDWQDEVRRGMAIPDSQTWSPTPSAAQVGLAAPAPTDAAEGSAATVRGVDQMNDGVRVVAWSASVLVLVLVIGWAAVAPARRRRLREAAADAGEDPPNR